MNEQERKIAAGVVGLVCATVNYFAYKRMLKKGKEKYAAEIMAYKQELLG